jgi:hypothetical protein
MKKTSLKYVPASLFVIFVFLAAMIPAGSALAGDFTMQQNLGNLSELTSMWSKQLNSGKLTPEARAKLAELLSQTSKVLRDMSEKPGGEMQMNYGMKIEEMKKDWDPFDTSDKM